jgi:hypothetical protein
MKNKTAAKQKKRLVPTQQHLLVAEIKNDTVVMKDGTLRAALIVSSLNFALKNDDEQNAIIAGYVSFLNGLEYPLQVVIQSRNVLRPANELACREIPDKKAGILMSAAVTASHPPNTLALHKASSMAMTCADLSAISGKKNGDFNKSSNATVSARVATTSNQAAIAAAARVVDSFHPVSSVTKI